MLDEVKLLLNLTDNSKDHLINFYIKKITAAVIDYCNLKEGAELSTPLLDFITFKVAQIVGGNMTFSSGGSNANGETEVSQGVIKSISRGDVSITYDNNVTSSDGIQTSTSGYSSSLTFSKEEKQILNKHRRIRFC